MEQLELVAVQLDEALNLIKVGRIPQLRLAFLLIDNAAELMMYRTTKEETEYQFLYVSMHHQAKLMQSRVADDAEIRARIQDLENKIIPEEKLKEIDREFRAKVNFLVARGRLDPSLGTILKKLHRYRNDMYHQARIRKALIETAALVYFDVACALLAAWAPPRMSSTSEPYTDLERFGIGRHDLFKDGLCNQVAQRLRDEAGVDATGVRSALISHLNERLDELDEMISFVIEEGVPPEFSSLDDAIRLIQADLMGPELPPLEDLRQQRFPVQSRTLRLWRIQVTQLAKVTDRYEMYSRFAAIEDRFETFEERVRTVAGLVDSRIQFEIDQARGK